MSWTRETTTLLSVLLATFVIVAMGCSQSEDRAAQRDTQLDLGQAKESIERAAEEERGITQLDTASTEPQETSPVLSPPRRLPNHFRPPMASPSRTAASAADEEMPANRAVEFEPGDFVPKTASPSRTAASATDEEMPATSAAEFEPGDFPPPAARSTAEEATVALPDVAMADKDAGTTTVDVFYATDRKSRTSVTSEEWLQIHFSALLSGLVYLIAFGAVFVSTRKVLCGLIAIIALAAFLYLGQNATLEWQTAKRLQANGDIRYLSELRDSGPALDYGKCEVSIPASHRIGQIDRPSLIKLEFSENPDRHMVLNRVVRSSKDQFYHDILDVLDQSQSHETLVFIHGYNVSFENAVKRTAQIAHDLEFEGAPVCYSWSSYGSLANYTHDMANADATVVPLHDFLLELVERTGNSTVHLIAHSMGNRALLQVLDRIAVGRSDREKLFGQLVMAAPDVSAHDFRTRYADAAMQLADIVTLYASSNDRALLASTEIHGHNRAGLAGDHLVTLKGVDTVDVSEIDTSFLGHSYYGNHPDLIKDLQAVVELAQPASKRRWLTRILDSTGPGYFRFANLRAQAADPAAPPTHR